MLADRDSYLKVAGVIAAVAVTGVASRLSLDLAGTSVPQSAQTLAVLGAGIFLGCRWGALAMAAYLVLGAAGLPLFSGGESGVEHLLGPTGGYLAGFIVGAALSGWWVERGRASSFSGALLGMVAAHTAILVLGWSRLALAIGVVTAWKAGIAPFLLGAVIKSAIAALLAFWTSSRSIHKAPSAVPASSALLDRFLPQRDVRRRYEIQIAASPDAVWTTLRSADFSRPWVIRWLLRLRGLGRRRSGPLTLDAFERARFAILEEVEPSHIVLGLSGQFWRPTGELQDIDRESFLAGAPEGFARAAWSFELRPDGQASTHLATETRVMASDDRSRRSFLLYWRLVGPFSGLMRRAMLRQVEAEACAPARSGVTPRSRM
jgi:biotin transport system substrate-specific component